MSTKLKIACKNINYNNIEKKRIFNQIWIYVAYNTDWKNKVTTSCFHVRGKFMKIGKYYQFILLSYVCGVHAGCTQFIWDLQFNINSERRSFESECGKIVSALGCYARNPGFDSR